eukprot:TRINITY_DN17147_c0_g2_i1.p1 TRINITY_DN17147_c0_g2~~TRINITY_DN17147_c0_g2_i1.p1  ORF type:complete len:438 (-),score=85.50 TRINITY_DN17147_c0_g2_i1:101-1414(-)
MPLRRRPPSYLYGLLAYCIGGASDAAPPAAVAASEDVQEVLRVQTDRGGGGSCERDVDCGWLHEFAVGKDRRDFPSGNGARCLVGRCVCANEFENKYACSRCTMLLESRYSFGNKRLERTTRYRDELGRHHDFCDLPMGGAPCEVGKCLRDEHGLVAWCPGDVECEAAGLGSGICVGAEEETGRCVCAKHRFCDDCSLQIRDVIAGATCDTMITGGAICHTNADCSGDKLQGYCASRNVPKLEHKMLANESSFCRCEKGYTCRRCSHDRSDVERGAKCSCDKPSILPRGGNFRVREIGVSLTAPPWDSHRQCDVFYTVHLVERVPAPPLWAERGDAAAYLLANGSRLQRFRNGSAKPVVLRYDDWRAQELDVYGHRRPQLFYIWAVSVPKKGWLIQPSEVVVSKGLFLSVADRLQACSAVLLLLLLIPAVAPLPPGH